MGAILTPISEVFTACMGWVASVGETVVANPILLFGVIVGFVGVGIGLFSRLLHV